MNSVVFNEVTRNRMITRHYPRQSVIISQGNENSTFFYIAEGFCIIQTSNSEGSVYTIDKLGPGDFFGESEIFNSDLKTAEVVAITDCEIWTMEEQDLLSLIREDHSFCLALLRELCDRAVKYGDNASAQILYSVEQRVAQLILNYGDLGKDGSLSRKDIINFTKASERSVTRALTVLVRSGAISRPDAHHIQIADRSKLQEIASL